MTKTIQQIKEDLQLTVWSMSLADLENHIIETFEDYSYKGESSIITNVNNDKTNISAYVNHKDAPMFNINIKQIENQEYIIVGVYLY